MAASDSESVVSGNRVFTTSLDFNDSGEEVFRITALNLSSGEILWSTLLPETSYSSQDISSQYPVRPLATPVIVGDRVISVGYGSSVHCVDVANGNTVWSVDLVKDYGAEPVQYGAATSPWSDGARVLVACGGTKALVLSLDIATGKLQWACGKGGASYCSFVPFTSTSGETALVYAAQDELIAIAPSDGSILWSYSLPKQGLTNSVTPLCVAPGKLLLGGQGIGGTCLLSVEKLPSQPTNVVEVWKSGRQQPFYCNWVQLRANPERVVGFAGKTFFVLDWTTGRIVSQIRGWTDSNVTDLNDTFLVVRGDGFLGKMKLQNDKPVMVAGNSSIRDRVWSAPVVIGDQILIRGRLALYSVGMDELESGISPPTGTNVTSMDAMYGTTPEAVAQMQKLATESPSKFSWEDYQLVAADRSKAIGEGNFVAIIDALEANHRTELAYRISEDWQKREPESAVAFERSMQLLRLLNRNDQATAFESQRLVNVEFIVRCDQIPEGIKALYVTGNAKGLGGWKNSMLRLDPQTNGIWRGTAIVPKGELQFKITGGNWDTEETRADGRTISNRRARVANSRTIEVAVATLKSPQSANRSSP